jgi:hypothetical protein
MSEKQNVPAPKVRFSDDICIHIIDYSEEEKTEQLQVIRQIYATMVEKQNIVTLAEKSLDKIKQACNASIFLHEILPFYETQLNNDVANDDRFEHREEEEEDTSPEYRLNRYIAPKKRKNSKLKRGFKPRQSPRLMGAKCTRSGRCYG